MSQPSLDNIEAGAMQALSVPEPGTIVDAAAVTRNLAQVVLDLVHYIRVQEASLSVVV